MCDAVRSPRSPNQEVSHVVRFRKARYRRRSHARRRRRPVRLLVLRRGMQLPHSLSVLSAGRVPLWLRQVLTAVSRCWMPIVSPAGVGMSNLPPPAVRAVGPPPAVGKIP